MRRSFRLLFVLLAVASAAEAQQARRTPDRGAASLGLRGNVAPDAPNAQTPPAISSLRAPGREPVIYGAQGVIQPLSAAAPGVGGVAQQCRLSCAQTYYFCLSSSQADDCPTSWSQCRAGCSSDPLSSSY